MRITVAGGDARMPYAAEVIGRAGHEVSLSAHGEVPLSPEALAEAEAILLPHPLTRDGVQLFAPLSPLCAPLSALSAMIPEGAILLAGQRGGTVGATFPHHKILSYGEDERFLEANARTTAEGALSLLMQRLPTALADTPCLLLGSGRLARALATLLSAFGAPLCLLARNPSPLPCGIRPLPDCSAAEAAIFCQRSNFLPRLFSSGRDTQRLLGNATISNAPNSVAF